MFFVIVVILNIIFGIISIMFIIKENIDYYMILWVILLIISLLLLFGTIWLLSFHFLLIIKKTTTYQYIRFDQKIKKLQKIRMLKKRHKELQL